MNDSVAENVVEEINNRSLHEGGANNESFSHFQGSIEVNMFASKFGGTNTNRRNSDKFLNGDEINFTKFNLNAEGEKAEKTQRFSRSQERKSSQKISKTPVKKKMSLDMNQTSSNNFTNRVGTATEKKNVKSVRSKKFLIPLDPNLYKVDMEEVKRKFNETKYKKRRLDRLDSSKLMGEKTQLMTSTSKIDSREENRLNDSLRLRESHNFSSINKNLIDNINYLKQISEENPVNEVSSKGSEKEVKQDKPESSSNLNPPEQKEVAIPKEVKTLEVAHEEKLKKSKEEVKIEKSIPKAKTKSKEPEKKYKKIVVPATDKKIDKIYKSRDLRSANIKTVTTTPKKAANNSKIKIKVVDKKSPEKRIEEKIEIPKKEDSNTKVKSISNQAPNINVVQKGQSEAIENPPLALVNTVSQKPQSSKDITRLEKLGSQKAIKTVMAEVKTVTQPFCHYCIKKIVTPVLLNCKHMICYQCALEIHYINEFIKIEKVNYLKCPKCDQKTSIKTTIEDLKVADWEPVSPSNAKKKQPTSICEICPSSKPVNDFAEYECLNCDILCCYQCKIR